jgi:hypothetical protein
VAELKQRVFAVDVLKCAFFGSRRRWIAALPEGETIVRILEHLPCGTSTSGDCGTQRHTRGGQRAHNGEKGRTSLIIRLDPARPLVDEARFRDTKIDAHVPCGTDVVASAELCTPWGTLCFTPEVTLPCGGCQHP